MLANMEPTDSQLRYFGASLATLFLAFAALCYWKWEAVAIAAMLLGLAILLAGVYYLVPSTRRPIYRGFRIVTYPIQLTVTALVLAIVYFGMLTPIGLLLRMRGVNIRTKRDLGQTLWTPKPDSAEPSDYFKTY